MRIKELIIYTKKELIKEFMEDLKLIVRDIGYDSKILHDLRYKWEEKIK